VAARLAESPAEAQVDLLLRHAALLLSRAGLDEAAEKYLRTLAATADSGYEALAVWLADRARLDEAVSLCLPDDSAADGSRPPVSLVRVLTAALKRSPSPLSALAHEPVQRAERRIAEALEAGSPSVELLLELGVLRGLQDRTTEGIALLDQALAQEPENLLVMNNLAILLAEARHRHDEALRLIDRAISKMPNSTELLDSKAQILISLGRPAEARPLLAMICTTNSANSRYRLHMAMALEQLGEGAQAVEQAGIAIADRIEDKLLAPSERRFVSRMKAAMKGPLGRPGTEQSPTP